MDLVKIGAIGVRISRWITMHGFALNVTLGSEVYAVIVPCGITGRGVSSIRELTGREPSTEEEAAAAFVALGEVFEGRAATLEDWSDKEIEGLV